MLRFLRATFLILLTTALLWAGVVWHWQRSGGNVTPRDLAVGFVALPLLVIGGFFALRWAWRRANLSQAEAAAPAVDAAPAASAASPGADERLLTMQWVAHGVVISQADDAASALQLCEQTPAVQLDPVLRDLDGLGIFTRRCDGVDVSEVPDAETFALAARALVLADRALEPVLRVLADLAPGDEHQGNAASPAERRRVRLLWALPESAAPADRDWVAVRAQERLARAGMLAPAFEWQLEVLPAAHGEALLVQAERRLLLAHRHRQDELVLLVAAHSELDEQRLWRMDGEGRLMTAQRPQGSVMPGEAAVVLLLAPPELQLDRALAPVRLHRLSTQRRDKPIDEAGRVSAQAMAEAMRQALQVSGVEPEQIERVVADTGLSAGPRLTELLDSLQATVPHLQALEDCLRTGAASGDCGLVAAPLALALAAEQVRAAGRPAAMVAHADPQLRMAAVLSPRPEPAATA
jgi:hypothetical protein